eukprot:g3452.t1
MGNCGGIEDLTVEQEDMIREFSEKITRLKEATEKSLEEEAALRELLRVTKEKHEKTIAVVAEEEKSNSAMKHFEKNLRELEKRHEDEEKRIMHEMEEANRKHLEQEKKMAQEAKTRYRNLVQEMEQVTIERKERERRERENVKHERDRLNKKYEDLLEQYKQLQSGGAALEKTTKGELLEKTHEIELLKGKMKHLVDLLHKLEDSFNHSRKVDQATAEEELLSREKKLKEEHQKLLSDVQNRNNEKISALEKQKHDLKKEWEAACQRYDKFVDRKKKEIAALRFREASERKRQIRVADEQLRKLSDRATKEAEQMRDEHVRALGASHEECTALQERLTKLHLQYDQLAKDGISKEEELREKLKNEQELLKNNIAIEREKRIENEIESKLQIDNLEKELAEKDITHKQAVADAAEKLDQVQKKMQTLMKTQKEEYEEKIKSLIEETEETAKRNHAELIKQKVKYKQELESQLSQHNLAIKQLKEQHQREKEDLCAELSNCMFAAGLTAHELELMGAIISFLQGLSEFYKIANVDDSDAVMSPHRVEDIDKCKASLSYKIVNDDNNNSTFKWTRDPKENKIIQAFDHIWNEATVREESTTESAEAQLMKTRSFRKRRESVSFGRTETLSINQRVMLQKVLNRVMQQSVVEMYQATAEIRDRFSENGKAADFWDTLSYNLDMKAKDTVLSEDELKEMCIDQYQSVSEIQGIKEVDEEKCTKQLLVEVFKEFYLTIPGQYLVELWKQFPAAGIM